MSGNEPHAEYTCEACTAVTTKYVPQTPHIYRRVSAKVLGNDHIKGVRVTWDNDLTVLQNHERAARELLVRNFPQCRLRRMAYSQEYGYVFGVYYSREEEVRGYEAHGRSLIPNADGTGLLYEGDEFELN